jgi:hypothetical protein
MAAHINRMCVHFVFMSLRTVRIRSRTELFPVHILCVVISGVLWRCDKGMKYLFKECMV